MNRAACIRLAAALALCAAPVTAQQNLLTNPGFDGNLDGWSFLNYSSTALAYSDEDLRDAPTSGSAAATVSTETSGGTRFVAAQCVEVAPQIGYEYWGWAFIASGQDAAGSASIYVFEHSTTDCSDGPGSPHETDWLTALDSWEIFYVVHFTTNESTHSVSIMLGIESDGGAGADDLTALFDDIYFAVAPIFADGFEAGDTDAWSAAVGLPE